MIEEDDGPGQVDEEPEDVTVIDPFGLKGTEPVVINYVGFHKEVNATA